MVSAVLFPLSLLLLFKLGVGGCSKQGYLYSPDSFWIKVVLTEFSVARTELELCVSDGGWSGGKSRIYLSYFL